MPYNFSGSAWRSHHTFPMEIVDDHPLLRVGTALAVLDSGSAVSGMAPAVVSEQLGVEVPYLIGCDALHGSRLTVDWVRRRVVFNGAPARGDSVDLVPRDGIYQVPVETPDGVAYAYVDTAAFLSYAPRAAVFGRRPVGRRRDWSPLIGEFVADLYQLDVRVDGLRISEPFGVLPAEAERRLGIAGRNAYIIGAALFRGRVVELDFVSGKLTVARAETPRQLATTRAPVAGNAERTEVPVRLATRPVEGWRAWRLVRMHDGSPRLMSLSARDVWEQPVFVSSTRPAVTGPDGASGVHAYQSPAGLSSTLQHNPNAIVYGEVSLYGRTCVHEIGFRAERARIDRLYLRACGLHQESDIAQGQGARRFPEVSGMYCGCRALTGQEWLSYEGLEDIAAQLSTRYECDVLVDAQRPRGGVGSCAAARPVPSAHGRQSWH